MEAERSGLEDFIKEIVREGGCNKRKAVLIETDLNKMEERLEKYVELYDEQWECFQRTSEKKPAGIGTRPTQSSRIGQGGLESKVSNKQKKPHPRSTALTGAIFRGYLSHTLLQEGGRIARIQEVLLRVNKG